MSTISKATVPTIKHCPPWCEREHPARFLPDYPNSPDEDLSVRHRTVVRVGQQATRNEDYEVGEPAHVGIEIIEFGDDTLEDYEVPIFIGEPGHVLRLSAADALPLAAGLQSAVALLNGGPVMASTVEDEARADRIEANTPKVIPPCPPWCAVGPGHEYDSTLSADDDSYVRVHRTDANDEVVSIVQQERNRHGEISVDPPSLEIWQVSDDRNCTPEQARTLALYLLKMAAELDVMLGTPGRGRAAAARA